MNREAFYFYGKILFDIEEDDSVKIREDVTAEELMQCILGLHHRLEKLLKDQLESASLTADLFWAGYKHKLRADSRR